MAYDWESLTGTHLYRKILDDWCMLLDNTELTESAYHGFLAACPAMFLMEADACLTVSKLKLGSEYETDFVVVKEGYSDGTIYELIEIETPHTPLFDKSGKPAARFNAALQQIRDWKRFLMNNRSAFRRSFRPSIPESFRTAVFGSKSSSAAEPAISRSWKNGGKSARRRTSKSYHSTD